MKSRTTMTIGLGLFASVIGGWMLFFYLGRLRADQVWAAAQYPKLKSMGTVKRLSILPLVDSLTAQGNLAGEAGVSYLIRADDTVILFDTGLNPQREHPSPLLRNMEALGVSLEKVDYFVISHLHLDHVGGIGSQFQRTFNLSSQSLDLGGRSAFVPEPMTYPTAQVEVVDGPRVLAPGVASMGPIPRQLFFFGWTPEQSLAVNVEGKGIVLIVGCGHPTLQRIVERAEMLFDEPIYGIIGGLHYPVTELPVQRIVGTGNWPWDPANKQQVEANIAYLQRRRPKLVALSPHDSCNWSRQAFRQAFRDAYQDVTVGKEIIV